LDEQKSTISSYATEREKDEDAWRPYLTLRWTALQWLNSLLELYANPPAALVESQKRLFMLGSGEHSRKTLPPKGA
jgi:hypothetical protein